jgi:hypothetical protein
MGSAWPASNARAQVLASPNHPNIASIYGLEESGDRRALVMQLGRKADTCRTVGEGAIPVDEAIT